MIQASYHYSLTLDCRLDDSEAADAGDPGGTLELGDNIILLRLLLAIDGLRLMGGLRPPSAACRFFTIPSLAILDDLRDEAMLRVSESVSLRNALAVAVVSVPSSPE